MAAGAPRLGAGPRAAQRAGVKRRRASSRWTLTLESGVADGTWTTSGFRGSGHGHRPPPRIRWHAARAAAGRPPSTRISGPAPTIRRPGCSTWTSNHLEAGINYPNTFPRFAGQGFADARQELALAALRSQRPDDRRLVRGIGSGTADSPDPHSVLGSRGRRRRGAALCRQGQPRHCLHRKSSEARVPPRSTAGCGILLWVACQRNGHPGRDHAHRVVVIDADDIRRCAAGRLHGAQRPKRSRLAVRLGVLPHTGALPGAPSWHMPRARSAGCRFPPGTDGWRVA